MDKTMKPATNQDYERERISNVDAFKRFGFSPYQDQHLYKEIETPDQYIARGGVVHFGGGTVSVICGEKIGAMVRVWKKVTCLACFKCRAEFRKITHKRG